MREILFRGKRVDNGEWVYGNLNYGTIEIESIKDSYFISDFNVTPWDKKFYSVISETVGQSTGMTDKNGKKIFEGDIVTTLPTEDKNLVVRFDGGGFCLDGLLLRYYRCFGKMAVKVIGNIYDNPELLEVTE